jgi:aminoglycoside phosphotransferase (APT) family kinase protein
MDEEPRLGPLVGLGRTAEVFALGEDRVVKLMRPAFPETEAELEARAANRVTDANLAAPRFHGLVRIDGRPGLVYDRVTGPSMLDELLRDHTRGDPLARLMAELHADMHGRSAGTLPSLVEGLRHAIERAASRIGDDIRNAALRRLEELPDGDALAHGDLHPGNVILTSAGPCVIDWLTASRGPAAADVARSRFLVADSIGPGELAPTDRRTMESLRGSFATTYLARYRELRQVRADEIDAWRLPILAARAAEGVDGELPHLRRLIAAEL